MEKDKIIKLINEKIEFYDDCLKFDVVDALEELREEIKNE